MKKLLAILLILIMVISLATGCAPAQDAKETQGTTTGDATDDAQIQTFTVEVTHKDGTVNTYTYPVSDDDLGAILVENGLAIESESAGMYNTIDGETTDWDVDHSYWCFYVGDEVAFKGMNDTKVKAGDVFKLVYTFG